MYDLSLLKLLKQIKLDFREKNINCSFHESSFPTMIDTVTENEYAIKVPILTGIRLLEQDTICKNNSVVVSVGDYPVEYDLYIYNISTIKHSLKTDTPLAYVVLSHKYIHGTIVFELKTCKIVKNNLADMYKTHVLDNKQGKCKLNKKSPAKKRIKSNSF